jgi:hypothetical protein
MLIFFVTIGISVAIYLRLPTPIKSGNKKKVPTSDIVKPPIVPAAKGNQKASFVSPIMNGINPSMVDTTVNKMG